jgi:catechol 2,3-dioxygenase-like lactoylglutathione lyase family enzyme
MSQPLLTRIDTVFLPVRSLDAAIEWYRTHLGWPLVWQNEAIAIFQVDGGTPLTLLQHRYPGFAEIPEGEEFEPVRQVGFNLLAPEIEATHARFRESGVRVSEVYDHGDVQEFHLWDGDGNLLSVVRC